MFNYHTTKFIIFFSCFTPVLSAYATTQSNNTDLFYWPSRLSAEILGGTLGMIKGDGMVPLYGDGDNSFFFNGQAKYGNDSDWGGAAGLGYRHIYNNARILGAYIFADGSSFSNDGYDTQTFWFITPGVESLGNLFDFRINGYIPVSSQQKTAGSYSQTTFAVHTQYNTVFDILNSTGPGIDGEVGIVKIPYIKYLRAYVGAYYFEPEDQSSITGVSGRIVYPFSHHVALTAVDTYDNNNHNAFQLGLRFTIGGRKDDIKGEGIERRIVDPINRNLATQYTGSDVPVIMSQKIASSTPTLNNIYFFTNNGGTTFNLAQTTNNCTFEHPCSSSSFNQTNVSDIASFATNANLYFSPGSYSLGSQLALPNGQSMFGRTADYTQAAAGSQRAQFNGGISLGGDNLLDSISITNTSTSQTTAVNIDNVNNVTLNNVLVDSETAFTTDTNIVGINLNAANNVNINNSQVVSNTSIGPGIASSTVTNLLATNSQFNVSNTIFVQNYTANFIAFNGVINLQGGNTANFNNIQVTANGTGTQAINSLSQYGIQAITGDQVTITNSTISVNLNKGQNLDYGIVNQGAIMTVENSTINVQDTDTSDTFATYPQAYGILASSGTTNIINDEINVSTFSSSPVSADARSTGIATSGAAIVNLTDSTLNISSNTSGTTSGSSISYGIDMFSGGTTNASGTNIFNISATGTTTTEQSIIFP